MGDGVHESDIEVIPSDLQEHEKGLRVEGGHPWQLRDVDIPARQIPREDLRVVIYCVLRKSHSLSNKISAEIAPIIPACFCPDYFCPSGYLDGGSDLAATAKSIHKTGYRKCCFVIGIPDYSGIDCVKKAAIRVENGECGCGMGCCKTCQCDFCVEIPRAGGDARWSCVDARSAVVATLCIEDLRIKDHSRRSSIASNIILGRSLISIESCTDRECDIAAGIGLDNHRA